MQQPQARQPAGGLRQSLGTALTTKVKTSRVLLVGAGGIGCELLKNLVCCGFGSVTDATEAATNGTQATVATGETTSGRKAGIVVVDLDTIDLSNLNRQFLFRKQHIKKPKALVAKETASQFNTKVNIEAHHASIFDSKYNVEFFQDFDVVFNALDNITARRHVNRMCLAADVPLIESGTTGFNGQVQAIKRGVTECYDCTEKPVQKSFPICTIRSTPSQPIHCIVWAKSYLLPELFGASEDEQEEGTEMKVSDSDNAEELAKLKEESQALKKTRALMGTPDFAREVFNKVFHDDIERLRSMSEMWKSRKPPEALKFEGVCIDKEPEKHGEKLAQQDQEVWTLLDNLKVFCYSITALSKRAQAGESVIEFDKDDKDTLDFVAAAANLRSHIFGIPTSSEWDIKQMAGNIIPAIATSNAITASLCVLQGFKILRHQLARANAFGVPTANNHVPTDAQSQTGKEDPTLGGCKKVYLESKSTERLINSEALASPRPDCPVCSPFYATLILNPPAADPAASSPPATLQTLVDLLRARLHYDEFSITVGARIIYDPDLEDNLEKSLAKLGITGEDPTQFVTVTDGADEDVKVDLILSVVRRRPQDAPTTTNTDKALPTEKSTDADVSMKDQTDPEGATNAETEEKATDPAKADVVPTPAANPSPLQLLPDVIELKIKVQPAAPPAAGEDEHTNGVTAEDAAATNASAGEKRKREAEEGQNGEITAGGDAKRAKKSSAGAKEEALVIEDDGPIDLD